MLGLALAFFVTAALYASVGFGGGSTYTALLTLAEVDYAVLPAVSLICNIIVVAGATMRYAAAGEIAWKRVIPLVAVSAPLAFFGGLTPIRQDSFMLLLASALLVSGLLLLFQGDRREDIAPMRQSAIATSYIAGASTGYLAGLVGIGGGIFLAPILHLTRWGRARAIAATTSLFILVNSAAGLIGQTLKLSEQNALASLPAYWPLAVAVFIGGQVGTLSSLRLFSQTMLRRATGVLILYVAGQLLWKQFG